MGQVTLIKFVCTWKVICCSMALIVVQNHKTILEKWNDLISNFVREGFKVYRFLWCLLYVLCIYCDIFSMHLDSRHCFCFTTQLCFNVSAHVAAFFSLGWNFHIIYIMTKAQVCSLYVAIKMSTSCTRN